MFRFSSCLNNDLIKSTKVIDCGRLLSDHYSVVAAIDTKCNAEFKECKMARNLIAEKQLAKL